MAGQQLFRCPKSYNSVHLRKEMYGSKPNGYRTVGTFRTAFTFSELAGLIDRNLKPKKIKKTPKNGCLFNTACVP
ncbi:hypothetical protein [Escherichia coli]|uniref:hypothetical protein n=1 Tax=Escherichia coli TaxID=562 RepID=UPI00098A242D|nr:hypothetical protein [Escherichia coli]